MADVTSTVKDAAYVTLGLGVLGIQKAQVRRVELAKQVADQRRLIEHQLAEASRTVQGLARDLDARVEPVRGQLGAQIDAVQERLPDPLREAVQHARAVARSRQGALRSRLGLDSVGS